MKLVFVFLALSAVVIAKPHTKDEFKRRYFPEEERANSNDHFALMEDESGKLHLINLKAPVTGRIANISDVTVYLYTRSNPTDGILHRADEFDGTIQSDLFDPTKKTVITTHGWQGTYLSKTNILTRDGVLATDDVNVLVVDYSRPANEFYTVARRSVPIVAEFIADFINKMMATYDIPSSQITLVGQSLGGQVIGHIGPLMNGKPSTLIALDPARVLFYIDEPENCIDPTDADFVHIIHTNGGFLGLRSSVGHADYYPNGGGMSQPGCGPDLFGTCAHYRAYYFFGESLLTGGFKAVKCGSYEDFKAGECDGNQVSHMGQYGVDREAHGDFYLDTAESEPYALN